MRRLHAALLVAAACALPRFAVVAIERGDLLSANTEKSDDFARILVSDGTFGFLPGIPSAYTQPLYTFFLAPLYWIFGRHWLVVGLAQTLVAVAAALLVLEIGRRIASQRVGIVAAVVTTVHPYLVWHDVHVNREILDTLLAAGIVLLTLVTAERRSWRWAGALGLVSGLAILGNSRLVLLPLVLLGYLGWRLRSWRTIGAVAAAGLVAVTLVLTPWVVRNRVSVGCYALTTDARALWKANNVQTYDILARGGWIDDVPNLPGAQLSPEFQEAIYRDRGELIEVDECAQMRFYRGLVTDFWREHPGEKARLAAQATGMLWSPTFTVERKETYEGLVGLVKQFGEPAYMLALYAAALAGLFVVSRAFAVLAVSLLAYNTLAAMVFAGNVRYRVPWDFLLALLAAAALARIGRRRA